MRTKKIAILTSGGDCAGMNTLINILVRVSTQRGFRVVGIKNGFKGLYGSDFTPLINDYVKDIYSLGGTILKTSRFKDLATDFLSDECAGNLKKAGIEVLIIIGGDGSLVGAQDLMVKGVHVIFIPATIDNDLRYTKKSIGFDTAVNNACQYIENVKQTMQSLSRGVVFEVMGKYCGDIALYTAISSASDIIAVPEKPINEKELFDKVKDCIFKKNKIPTIIVSENMFDVRELAEKLTNLTHVDFKYSVVGYIQRGGNPTVIDKALAVQYGVFAIDLIEKGIYNKAIGMNASGNIVGIDIDKARTGEDNYNYSMLRLFYQLNK